MQTAVPIDHMSTPEATNKLRGAIQERLVESYNAMLEHNEHGSVPGVLCQAYAAIQCLYLLRDSGIVGTTIEGTLTLEEVERDVLNMYKSAYEQVKDSGSFPAISGTVTSGAKGGSSESSKAGAGAGAKAKEQGTGTHPISFSDIIGATSAQEVLKRRVIKPIQLPHMYREAARGVLLYGPPGTGKTMVAMALATEVQALAHGLMMVTFKELQGSSLKSHMYGETAKLIEAAYADASSEAQALAKAAGMRASKAILFLDEAESFLASRQSNTQTLAGISVTPFLVTMGGGKYKNVTTIIATNLPWSLDSAVQRRFEEHVLVDIPGTKEIFANMRRLIGQWFILPLFIQTLGELGLRPVAAGSKSPLEDDEHLGGIFRDEEVDMERVEALLSGEGGSEGVRSVLEGWGGQINRSRLHEWMNHRWVRDVFGLGGDEAWAEWQAGLAEKCRAMRGLGFSQSDTANVIKSMQTDAAVDVEKASTMHLLWVPSLTHYKDDYDWQEEHKDASLAFILQRWISGEQECIPKAIWVPSPGKEAAEASVRVVEILKSTDPKDAESRDRMWRNIRAGTLNHSALNEALQQHYDHFKLLTDETTAFGVEQARLFDGEEEVAEMVPDLFARVRGLPEGVSIMRPKRGKALEAVRYVRIMTARGMYAAQVDRLADTKSWEKLLAVLEEEGTVWWMPAGVAGGDQLISYQASRVARGPSGAVDVSNGDELMERVGELAFDMAGEEHVGKVFKLPLLASFLPDVVRRNMHAAQGNVLGHAKDLHRYTNMRWKEYAAMVKYSLSTDKAGAAPEVTDGDVSKLVEAMKSEAAKVTGIAWDAVDLSSKGEIDAVRKVM